MPHIVNAGLSSRIPPLRQAPWLVAFLVLVLALPGCGYTLDSPRLPLNASRLSIATIKNSTTTGEMDIRLGQILRSRLLRQSSFDLVSVESSDLSLEIEMEDLKITRGRDLTTTTVSNIVYQLKANVSLLDRRTKAYYYYKAPVIANSRLDFDTPVIETPAIRDEGLTGVLEKFADRLEALVLLGF